MSRALARPTHQEKRREKSNSYTPALRAKTLDFQGSELGEDGMSAPHPLNLCSVLYWLCAQAPDATTRLKHRRTQ